MNQYIRDILSQTTRRDFLKAVGVGAVALGSSSCNLSSKRDTSSKPNIVFILADDNMGPYDIKGRPTPNLDRMAANSTSFKTCFATPVCQPSRVEILSGKYGCHTGITNLGGCYGWNPGYDITKENTFARSFQTAGYATTIAGKWHVTGPDDDCTKAGFDEYCLWAQAFKNRDKILEENNYTGKNYGDGPSRYWHPAIIKNGKFLKTTEEDYGPNIFCDYIIDFMKKNSQADKPFLAYYSMVLVHAVGSLKDYEDPVFRKTEHLPPIPDFRNPGKKHPPGRIPWGGPAYCDHLVGKLIQAVDDLGVADNTYIFFTCDNGSGPPGDGKRSSTERGCHVPMFVIGPNVKKGQSSEALIDFTDVYPTLCDIAGISPPSDIDGQSFLPVLRGGTGKREWILAIHAGERILRDKNWLLEENHETQFGTFWYCGDSRAGRDTYKNVTNSTAPNVLAAKKKFEKIHAKYPAEKGLPLRQYGSNPIYDKKK